MRLPNDWVDELSRALEPDAFAQPAPLHLPLTHRMGLAQRLADLGATLEEVKADLANGFTSDRRSGRDGDYYCLSATRFDVFVNTQPEEESGLPLAVVTSVKPARRLAHRNGFASPTVSFHLPYEKVSCEVSVIHQAMGVCGNSSIGNARLVPEPATSLHGLRWLVAITPACTLRRAASIPLCSR